MLYQHDYLLDASQNKLDCWTFPGYVPSAGVLLYDLPFAHHNITVMMLKLEWYPIMENGKWQHETCLNRVIIKFG